eukprot:scaffold16220_cov20-Tisochrysis_lutea.AAC.1
MNQHRARPPLRPEAPPRPLWPVYNRCPVEDVYTGGRAEDAELLAGVLRELEARAERGLSAGVALPACARVSQTCMNKHVLTLTAVLNIKVSSCSAAPLHQSARACAQDQ